jgi:hypothetical protein
VKGKELASVAVFLGFFGRRKFALGQRDAAFLGNNFDGFGKANFFKLLHEGEDVSRFPAAEAMKELAGVDGKGGSLFAVERAEASEALRARFLQRDVAADNLDDVGLLLHELGKV